MLVPSIIISGSLKIEYLLVLIELLFLKSYCVVTLVTTLLLKSLRTKLFSSAITKVPISLIVHFSNLPLALTNFIAHSKDAALVLLKIKSLPKVKNSISVFSK